MYTIQSVVSVSCTLYYQPLFRFLSSSDIKAQPKMRRTHVGKSSLIGQKILELPRL